MVQENSLDLTTFTKKRYVGGRYKEQLVLGWYKRFVEKFALLIWSKEENVTCFLIV